VYCKAEQADTVIAAANSFNIDAKVIGRTEVSNSSNRLSLTHGDQLFEYTS
jgi:hypothetical protein